MKLPVLVKKHPWMGLASAIVLGGVVVGISNYLFHRDGENQNFKDLTIAVEQQTLQATIEANGTVEPVQSANISPETSGRIKELYVEQGDRVEQGEPIAQMKNDQLQAQRKQAQAQLEQTQAQLEQARTTRPEEIEQARSRLQQAQARLEQVQARSPLEIEQLKAQVESAQSQLELAQQRLNRNQALLAEGAIAEDEFDAIRNDYRNAQANLREQQQRLEQAKATNRSEIKELEAQVAEARQNLNQLQKGSREEEITRLEANVASARAQLQEVESQLQDSLVTTPFTGVVAQKNATEGSFVAPTTANAGAEGASSTSIVTVNQGLEVLAEVPEVNIGTLQANQSVEVVANAFPEEVFHGEIKVIAPEAITQDNVTSFEVRINLQSGFEQLQSGMNVDVTFLGQQINEALMIPTVAVVTQQGETGVIKLNEQNEPAFQPVTLGATIDNQIQILEGLQPRDRVFTDLPDSLRQEVDLDN